jgi:hypothetical protein
MSGGERQEGARSAEHGAVRGGIGWRGGPLEALRAFLAARAWGIVREDYSAHGDAWRYFPFDGALRGLPLSEDGLAGLCDREQRLCFALAFRNGRDPILKERIFGLRGAEGNHGGDAKEYWGISTPLTASRLAGAITIRRLSFRMPSSGRKTRAARWSRSRASNASWLRCSTRGNSCRLTD